MTKEFKDCLKRRKIMEFERAPELATKELAEAISDLRSAEASFTDHDFKWAIIQSYYSMFHAARTLIYVRGYRERSHYCLIIALRSLYVAEGLLDVTLIESLHCQKDDWMTVFLPTSASFPIILTWPLSRPLLSVKP